MSTIEKIREILGDKTPEQLAKAVETAEGVRIPLYNRSGGWDRLYEEQNLGRALAPLADMGWTIKPGPTTFRDSHIELLVIPPSTVTTVDTATLPLRDRIHVDGKIRRKTGRDVIDALEINEDEGSVTYDTATANGSAARKIEEAVADLKAAGWRGSNGRRFGKPGVFGTLTAPAKGLQVKPARIEAFLN